ncbi:fimbrial protein [Pseudomonas sp.]|uniref:fimbrial protein n=1 Tax=Pseudomonas sp. TaxID=306 RepID=UPI003C795155
MKKLSLALLTLSILSASGSVLAEEPTTPTKGGSGKITFTGNINNDACTVDGANADRSIAVDMGNVSIKDMGTVESPASGRVTTSAFNLNVNCNAGTKVSMIFNAKDGTGLVAGKGVLALKASSASATGVAIALLDSNGSLIDLEKNPKIESTMYGTETAGGDTELNFSAAYVTTGAKDTATAGDGSASLPFILQYE